MARWIGFLLAVALGVAAGLYYGWVLNPVVYVETTPESLRADYKADYVLMTAEIYAADGNLTAAQSRLAFLGDGAPLERVQDALAVGLRAGYTDFDLQQLRALAAALTTAQDSQP
ncbi:MAG: hypothetical protein OHK0052_11200 [Anaerolineales bacterium]